MEENKIITPQEFAEKMREFAQDDDQEYRHGNADDLMCELLKSLGYDEGIQVFEDMPKWYA